MECLVSAEYAYEKVCGWLSLRNAAIKELNNYFLNTTDWVLDWDLKKIFLENSFVKDKDVIDKAAVDVCQEMLRRGYVFKKFEMDYLEGMNVVSFEFYPQKTIAKLEREND